MNGVAPFGIGFAVALLLCIIVYFTFLKRSPKKTVDEGDIFGFKIARNESEVIDFLDNVENVLKGEVLSFVCGMVTDEMVSERFSDNSKLVIDCKKFFDRISTILKLLEEKVEFVKSKATSEKTKEALDTLLSEFKSFVNLIKGKLCKDDTSRVSLDELKKIVRGARSNLCKNASSERVSEDDADLLFDVINPKRSVGSSIKPK